MHRAHCIITIIRAIERRKIVGDDKDREHFVTRLGKIRTETKTIIYAWALMTNHAHPLLHSGPEGIAPFMRRFPENTQSSYNRRHRRHGACFRSDTSLLCVMKTPILPNLRVIST
jgi:putative transposase